jgi:hypothetical protein
VHLKKGCNKKEHKKNETRRWLSSGLLHREVWQKFTDVSEVLSASLFIIREMNKPREKNLFEI